MILLVASILPPPIPRLRAGERRHRRLDSRPAALGTAPTDEATLARNREGTNRARARRRSLARRLSGSQRGRRRLSMIRWIGDGGRSLLNDRAVSVLSLDGCHIVRAAMMIPITAIAAAMNIQFCTSTPKTIKWRVKKAPIGPDPYKTHPRFAYYSYGILGQRCSLQRQIHSIQSPIRSPLASGLCAWTAEPKKTSQNKAIEPPFNRNGGSIRLSPPDRKGTRIVLVTCGTSRTGPAHQAPRGDS
jgi:hypothetical protein